MKRPFMKFYTSDWRSDPRLRMCSMAARGLWLEMICLMHEAEPYGYLLVNGQVVTVKQLASLVGCTLSETSKLLDELERAGVYSVEQDVILSRRMVRDKAKADKDRENGKSGGNPRLIGEDKQGVNPQDKGQDKAHIPEARKKDSEASASDASASFPIYTDSKHELWGEGVPILVSLGVKERDARSNIGRWLKDAKDDSQRVLGAIQRARDARVVEPIAWITRAISTKDAGNVGPIEGNAFKRALGQLRDSLDADQGGQEIREPSPRLLSHG